MTNVESQDNLQKQKNYREQFTRLKRALRENYFLEAIFISYSIMEDRTESLLRHTDLWGPYLKSRKGREPNIGTKVAYIKDKAREKKSHLYHYFHDDLLDQILTWKEERNKLIHALLRQNLCTEDLRRFAFEGETIANELTNRVRSVNRIMDRKRSARAIV